MIKYTYNPPYNLWSGNRSDTLNKFKINYKGSIATTSALPEKGEFKGDTYNVLEDGSNYMWNGSSWDKFDANVYVGSTAAASGISGLVPPATAAQMNSLLTGMGTWQSAGDLGLALDDEVVHKTGDETISGEKTFSTKIKGSIDGTAKSLEYTSLGANYTMTPSDFASSKGKEFGVSSFVAGSLSEPTGAVGDYRMSKICPGTLGSYACVICTSPRRNSLHFGHFWDSAWTGWHDVFSGATHCVFEPGNSCNTIRKKVSDEQIYICGGADISSSAYICLYGGERETAAGLFSAIARTSSESCSLIGLPDGTLTWGGQSIQVSSDERIKTALNAVPDEVLDAWDDVCWGQFQFLAAVAKKGINARLHIGLLAQRVKAVFETHGLDACAYGILCHVEQPEVHEETTVVDVPEYVDDAGVAHPAQTHVEIRHEDAVDLWTVRYEEALAMEAACQRRRAERAEARVDALEDRLEALEARLG